MRICFALLLAVTALLAGVNSASGSPIKLRASNNLVQSIDAGRELRGEAKTNPEDEERLSLNFDWIKQLNAKMKGDPVKSLVKAQFKYGYNEGITTLLVANKLDPDDLVRMFRLDLSINRANKRGVKTSAWNFFLDFRSSYIDRNRQWRSAFPTL